jgi:hypothetical protein
VAQDRHDKDENALLERGYLQRWQASLCHIPAEAQRPGDRYGNQARDSHAQNPGNTRSCLSFAVMRFRDPLRSRRSAAFSQPPTLPFCIGTVSSSLNSPQISLRFTGIEKTVSLDCTNSGHAAVDGLHSIEKTILTNPCFPLTPKIEGVKTQSFFDSFLGFSGWCNVRGSSKVTFLTARSGRRASKGL